MFQGLVINPEFEDWLATDKLLYGWIRRTMTSDLQMQALHCRTSAQLWKCVQELTGTQMKSKIVQLKG